MWIAEIVFYGICKGSREIFKKKSYEKNTVTETLYVYILLGFLFVCPGAKDAFSMDFGAYLPWVIFKAFLVFLAWLFGFTAVSRMPVGLYGVLDLSRVLFSTGLGVLVLHERPGAGKLIGLVFVCAGLLLLKFSPKKKTPESARDEKVAVKYILASFTSAFLNACSGTLDKYLLGNTEITDNQLLFWYTLVMVILYTLYIIIRREKIDFRKVLKSPWVYLMALTFALGDKVLFMANADPSSTVALMTLLKQSGCVVIILGGKFVFKEKNTAYKLMCAAVVVAGIVIAAVFK